MCFMNFAINGYTKEYISLRKDGIGVEYTGNNEEKFEDLINLISFQERKNFWNMKYKCGNSLL